MVKIVEIMYCDLNEDGQRKICETFNTIPEEENWDVQPLVTIERELED